MTNELQIFNQDVIPVYTTDKGEKVVMGRELHERLKINTAYADWIKRMAEYGFEEGTDYSLVSQNAKPIILRTRTQLAMTMYAPSTWQST